MKRLFEEENGLLVLDEIVCKKDSFKLIMQDGIVSDDEITAQSDLVISLLKRIDNELDEKSKELVTDAIAELSVLFEINSLKRGE